MTKQPDLTADILIVENSAPMAASLAAIVVDLGMSVIAIVRTGEEALQIAFQRKPAVVLMDIGLDGMNGIDVTRRLRYICPACCVIIVSAHDELEYRTGAFDAGAVAYVLKVAVLDELPRAISACLTGAYLSQRPVRELSSTTRLSNDKA